MKQLYDRWKFNKTIAVTGLILGLMGNVSPLLAKRRMASGKRISTLGLDTSQSVEYSKAPNAADASAKFAGYKIDHSRLSPRQSWYPIRKLNVNYCMKMQKNYFVFNEFIKDQ